MPLAVPALSLALGLVVSPAELAARPPGRTTVLDARPASEYRRGHLPGAIRVDWTDYRNGFFRTGKLDDDLPDVARRLAGLGVDERRPVVVYGNARDGWGEEGRIVWMLRYLGHRDAAILDGGIRAWTAAGKPISKESERPLPGRFTARPNPTLRASADDVERLRKGAGVVLDVRTRDEWRGATPYFESRGGHVPGAVHLDWRDLLDEQGRLAPARARARLAALGIRPNEPIVTYCTGGVRSAAAWVLLTALGYGDVRNYDGSFWEWSADDRRPVERSDSP